MEIEKGRVVEIKKKYKMARILSKINTGDDKDNFLILTENFTSYF